MAPAAWLAPTLLSACSSSTSTAKPGTTTAPGSLARATGTAQVFVGFGTGNDPSQTPTQEMLARSFAQAEPGASVSFNRIPDSSTAQQKLTVQLASHTAPNVVLPIGISGIAAFLDQNVWLDLSSFMAASGVSLDQFQPSAFPAAKAVNYYGNQSKTVIGIPSGMFTHAVAYNKDLFKKAGVAEPPHAWATSEWTYDRLLEVATALTLDGHGRTPDKPGFDAGDIKQFGLGHWDTGIMLFGYGIRNYDPATKKVMFDSPAYIRGVQAGLDLTYKHHVLATDQLAGAIAAGASDPQQGAWQAGKVAMVDMCTCDLPSYGSGNNFAWDVAAWPKGPVRTVATLNLDVGAIPAASSNHELSWAVLQYFLTNPANERKLATQGYGAIPALKSEAPAFVDFVRNRFPGIDLKVFIDAIPYCTEDSEEWYPASGDIANLDTLQPMYDGKVAAADILTKYQQQAQGLVNKWFTTHKAPGTA